MYFQVEHKLQIKVEISGLPLTVRIFFAIFYTCVPKGEYHGTEKRDKT